MSQGFTFVAVRRSALLAAALTLVGCSPFPLDDHDGDGFGEGYDCDDSQALIYPGAPERCTDGGAPVDEDCDGAFDEGEAIGAHALHLDVDGDGHGAIGLGEGPPWVVFACDGLEGYAPQADDCDDSDPAVSPDAPEVCAEVGELPADDDCDGRTDEGLDADKDGVTSCDTNAMAADCDDLNPEVSPLAQERCGESPAVDDDCDGRVDESGDEDDDGFFVCGVGGIGADCDDTDGGVFPGAPEACDARDDDCDGHIDEGWDGDGDGYTLCGDDELPPDCADGDASFFPGAEEACDGRDQDCDGRADEGFADFDSDGAAACIDCDDTDSSRSPLSFDDCDAFDDDCDGAVDEAGACPCPVEPFGGHTYLFCPYATDWFTAKTACETMGYHLVQVEDEAENTWLAYTAGRYIVVDWWIGLSDLKVEGLFAWTDGSDSGFTRWAPGEPNDLGGEDCVGFYPDGQWNDEDCQTPWFRYICEAP